MIKKIVSELYERIGTNIKQISKVYDIKFDEHKVSNEKLINGCNIEYILTHLYQISYDSGISPNRWKTGRKTHNHSSNLNPPILM